MNLIVRANKENFSEVKNMCEALEELLKDKIEEREKKATQEGIQQGIQQGEQQKLIDLIQKKLKKQKTIEQIAEELEETVENILPFYNQLKEQINKRLEASKNGTTIPMEMVLKNLGISEEEIDEIENVDIE